MTLSVLEEQIRKKFPDAEVARRFVARQNLLLEEKYGFTPENTRFAEGGCCDEINEPELILMQSYWGERFKFGGLAGYCHGGRSGINAVSHHVPGTQGFKNLLLMAGAHIGYHDGQWGRVIRKGQSRLTTSCGSLCAVLEAGCEKIRNREPDPLDRQQHAVEQILLPYLQQCKEEGKPPSIVEATIFLMKRIDQDLLAIIGEIEKKFQGQIALITGITINTEEGNFFSPWRVEVRRGG